MKDPHAPTRTGQWEEPKPVEYDPVSVLVCTPHCNGLWIFHDLLPTDTRVSTVNPDRSLDSQYTVLPIRIRDETILPNTLEFVKDGRDPVSEYGD